ncbi:GNAT family N-acetyltransferase [Budvicia aquatica]|uniref:Acetyltransferase (GNAT) family n=2 Tax=Budvicia aquatica TaxID=82979 RepID=A0A484ZFU5_9GAMM|nr:GNAT family N-acetyltransferase [Budvicia aquatica]MBP9643946.1 GNAT family N-acetyltransferase [Budvicia sp.]GKX52404.1 acetyltransferase [Budvicia aquatica]VFS46511.1 Acetyltransferase (GNAT) family [Budvicia aquatica]
MRYYIRPMTSVDLSNVLHIQASVYHADLLEGIEFFQNRLLLSAANCWVAEGEASLLGYLISYPWLRTFPPELDVMLENIPPYADSWFVHDCAISPAAQGLGVGKQLFTSAQKHALQQGFTHTSLVSLAQANSYWLRHGYTAVDNTPQLDKKLAQYGNGACYMYREVG